MLTRFSLSKNKPPLCVPSLRSVFPQSSSLYSLNQTIFPNYNDMCRIGFLLFETFLSVCLKSFLLAGKSELCFAFNSKVL